MMKKVSLSLYFSFACARMYSAKARSSTYSQNLKAVALYDGGQATKVGEQGVDKHRGRVGRFGAEVEKVSDPRR